MISFTCLVDVSICIHSDRGFRIRSWGWLVAFKNHHSGEGDTSAVSASQGGSSSRKHPLSWESGRGEAGGAPVAISLLGVQHRARPLPSSPQLCSLAAGGSAGPGVAAPCGARCLLRAKLLDRVGAGDRLFSISILHSQSCSVHSPIPLWHFFLFFFGCVLILSKCYFFPSPSRLLILSRVCAVSPAVTPPLPVCCASVGLGAVAKCTTLRTKGMEEYQCIETKEDKNQIQTCICPQITGM